MDGKLDTSDFGDLHGLDLDARRQYFRPCRQQSQV